MVPQASWPRDVPKNNHWGHKSANRGSEVVFWRVFLDPRLDFDDENYPPNKLVTESRMQAKFRMHILPARLCILSTRMQH